MFDLPNIKKMDLICLEADAFELLAEKLVEKVKALNNVQDNPFLTTEEACTLLRCKDETLLKYWKEGLIVRSDFSQKHIIYERESIMTFIKNHAKKYDDGNK